jgi:hypothetical protein
MKRLAIVCNRLCSRAEENPPFAAGKIGRHWPVLILGVVASVLTALSLGQDCTWDVLNYHFYSGYAFLNKPMHYDFAPAQVQSFFNPLQHVLSYLLLAYLPSIAGSIILAAIQGLNFYLVFRIAQILFRNWSNPFRLLICISSAATGCYSSIYILELGTTFGDSLSSLLILAGFLLILQHLASMERATPASNMRLGIAGAVLGVALGIKFTAAIYIAAIAVALSLFLLFSHRRIRPLIVFFVFMGLTFIAVYGYWGYSLYHEYQNPIFPYMNGIFRSPFFEPANTGDARFFARTWQQRFFYPFFFIHKNSLVSEIPFRDMRLALCYIAVAGLGVFGLFRFFRNRPRTGEKQRERQDTGRHLIVLAVFFSISYILWQNQFSVYRYLIVLELLAPSFLALVLACLIRKKFQAFLCIVLLNALICAFMIPANFGRQKFDDNFLKAEIPLLEDLDKSVVIMSGLEGTSFIIPHFPPKTRFVRISSNFHAPGKNHRLDNKIRGMLAQYDAKHTLVLISEKQDKTAVRKELSFYGVKIDEQACRPVLRRTGDVGYLCAMPTDPLPAQAAPEHNLSAEPIFKELPGVRLEIDAESAAGRDIIHLHLLGQSYSAIDLLYTINGEPQSPQKRYFLDNRQLASFPVRPNSPSGLYHFIGIRNSSALNSDPWIKVDTRLLIRGGF